MFTSLLLKSFHDQPACIYVLPKAAAVNKENKKTLDGKNRNYYLLAHVHDTSRNVEKGRTYGNCHCCFASHPCSSP